MTQLFFPWIVKQGSMGKISEAAVNLVKEKALEPWRRQRALQGRAGGEKNQENSTIFHENPEANVGSLTCSQSWSEWMSLGLTVEH